MQNYVKCKFHNALCKKNASHLAIRYFGQWATLVQTNFWKWISRVPSDRAKFMKLPNWVGNWKSND